ncbi:MAG: helicase-exonuclease AddAB subunit AddB [Lachnospiraceae bacterium]|nr:helicase-exonuclease AddAB subunit AddB [Lachnospiraceae bacterium]
MSLRYYMGPSGAGKSTQLYKEIINRSGYETKRNFLVVVPDQFTMQTQKDMVLAHPRGGIMNIDVLSFGRLAHRIFEEVGGNENPVLDDTGKSLILRKLAANRAEELKAFGKNLNRQGYIHEIKSMLSEFMQYGISTEKLDEMIKCCKERGLLHQKLVDLQVLYKDFLGYINEKYITTEETLDRVCRVLHKSEIVKDAVIVLDGFTGFTPIQNRLIAALLQVASEVIITVTIDGREKPFVLDGEQKLFHLSKKTIYSLNTIARESGVERGEDVLLMDVPVKRYEQNAVLAHLENNLFRYPTEEYVLPDNIPLEDMPVRIMECTTPKEEVKQMSLCMEELIRKNNWCYRDFAVVTGDLATYAPYIETRFDQSGIPYFMDQTRGIVLNPVIEYIKSALAIVLYDFKPEHIMHFLRSGMSSFSMEEADEFENYILAKNIHGRKRYEKIFTSKVKEQKTEAEKEIEKLLFLNEMRQKLLDELAPLLTMDKITSDMVKKLYDFLVKSKVEEKLHTYADVFLESGDIAREKEYRQIYGLIMDLLDQIVALIGEDEITLKEFKEILEAGFGEIQVGSIPQNVDRVVVGDIERTRLKPVKALFFLGVNDGNIPKSAGSGGLISDLDRQFILEQGFELAPTPRQQMFIQRLYLYLNMTKPGERLILSYAVMGSDGKSIRPSYLIETVKTLYPNLIIEKPQKKNETLQIAGMTDALELFAKEIRKFCETGEITENIANLYSALAEKDATKEQADLLMKYAFFRYSNNPLTAHVAKLLYGDELKNSVTRLETFARCAYAHFLQYGMRLKEREGFEFEAVDLGNVFHGVLEAFAARLEKEKSDWFHFTKEEGEQWIEEIMENQSVLYKDSVLYSNSRNRYAISRITRILKRTVFSLQKQLKKGTFTPKRFEMGFFKNIEMGNQDDMKMSIGGRIDRIDTYETDDKVYVKVMDYKSGHKKFDVVSFYYGLQLQLVVYMEQALEKVKRENKNKQVVPAAMLYYAVTDPIVKGQKLTGEQLNELVERELTMRGLVNCEENICTLIDSNLTKASTSSDVITVSTDKNGEFKSGSEICTTDEFEKLSEYVNKKMKEIGSRIRQGDVEKKPFKKADSTGCTYCAYRGICGFDGNVPGYEYEHIVLSEEKAMEKIMAKE